MRSLIFLFGTLIFHGFGFRLIDSIIDLHLTDEQVIVVLFFKNLINIKKKNKIISYSNYRLIQIKRLLTIVWHKILTLHRFFLFRILMDNLNIDELIKSFREALTCNWIYRKISISLTLPLCGDWLVPILKMLILSSLFAS